MNQEQRQRNGIRQVMASVRAFVQRLGMRVLQIPGMRRLLLWLLSLIDRLHWVLFESDFELAEVLLALPLFGWALVLALPGSSFGVGVSLRHLAPYENLIACFCGVMLGIKIVTAIFHWSMAHAVTMFVISCWWTYIAVTIFFTTNLSTGTAAYLPLAIGQAWAFFRFVARHELVSGYHER